MDGRSVRAVAAGLGTLGAIMFAVWRINLALPPPDSMPSPWAVLAASLLMGLAAEIPAGYVTARLSPRFPVRHAVAVAASAVALGGAFMSGAGLASFVGGAFLNAFQAPGILLGAWLQARGGDG